MTISARSDAGFVFWHLQLKRHIATDQTTLEQNAATYSVHGAKAAESDYTRAALSTHKYRISLKPTHITTQTLFYIEKIVYLSDITLLFLKGCTRAPPKMAKMHAVNHFAPDQTCSPLPLPQPAASPLEINR